ncbi:MAG TPA: hypothetical protein VGL98_07250 [Gammaproteobacteria bacterium]
MRRTLALFGAGVGLGAVAMFFARSHGGGLSPPAAPGLDPRDSLQTPQARDRAPRAIDFLTLATGSVSVTERAALFRLASEADRRTLESLLTQVAALPDIEGRRIGLEALFTRYAEIDATAAAAFARTLDLPTTALTPLFTTWARVDARGAVRALAGLEPQAAQALGVAMLEVLGNDDLGIARILSAAPQIDADRFRIEAAVAKAQRDPNTALERLLELPAAKASTAFGRIAVIWVERDALGALAAAEQLADPTQRNELKTSVLSAWARVDPEALVDYVLELAPEQRSETLRFGNVLQAFSLIDPQRALRAAEGVPGELGTTIRRAALVSLAREDPLAALSVAEGLPAGNEREQLLRAVATSYGRTDPDAALAWAQSLSPPSPSIVANVIAGLARVDPDRAIDLIFETIAANGDRDSTPLLSLVSNGALAAEHTARIADRLMATPGRRQALQMLTQMWAQRQPYEAARWLLARGSEAPRGALGQAAVQLARTDPAAAISYVDTVAPELRATWISSVAAGYALHDARAAATWVAQYRGEPGYDAAVTAVAGTAAQSDPVAAARLFDSIDVAQAPDAPQTASRIANAWAQRDPGAAASWAAAVASDDARASAISAVAGTWASRDAAGARSWALGLRASAARDQALTQVLSATTTSSIDHVLIDAFSDAKAKERGVNQAVRMIATRDASAARQLADQYLTDPAARQAAERFLTQDQNNYSFGPGSPPRLPPAR